MTRDTILQTLQNIEILEAELSEKTHRKATQKLSEGNGVAHRTAFASVLPTTGAFLRDQVIAYDAKVIFEIGSSVGYSTLWLALGAVQTGGHVHTSEVNEDRVRLALKHFQEAGARDIITMHPGDAIDTLRLWGGTLLDFVFMDEYKTDYGVHAATVLPLLKSGGVIFVDNIISHSVVTKDFVDLMSKRSNVQTELLTIDTGILKITKL